MKISFPPAHAVNTELITQRMAIVSIHHKQFSVTILSEYITAVITQLILLQL